MTTSFARVRNYHEYGEGFGVYSRLTSEPTLNNMAPPPEDL